MAYFLDPELAALTTGSNRRAPAQTSAAPAARRSNKYGKRCDGCGTWVPSGKGYLSKVGRDWVVYCTDCP